jgi:4-diphosphocytidyl-2-C-methyl-D-erythritol kinase
MIVHACAKINLTLDVFSKRADGYHGVASVMQAISLFDTLRIETAPEPGIRFTCDAPSAPDVPADATNLAVRAASAVLEARGLDTGLRLHLDKRIPSQAGLGGGSSDAAAVLRGVSRLIAPDLGASELRGLAAGLGSDVPFFLIGGTAVARGRGEMLTPLPDLPRFWLVVVKPEESVSTGWAYGALDAVPDRQSHRGTKRLEEALRQGDWGRTVAFQSNDFELPVFERYPALAWLHDELRMAGALTAHLCGSGAALYGVAEDEAAAHRIADLMRRKYAQVFMAHTLTRAETLESERAADVEPEAIIGTWVGEADTGNLRGDEERDANEARLQGEDRR